MGHPAASTAALAEILYEGNGCKKVPKAMDFAKRAMALGSYSLNILLEYPSYFLFLFPFYFCFPSARVCRSPLLVAPIEKPYEKVRLPY